jgi:flagellar biosynthesis/type III secretory pathway chaperone
MTNDFWEKEISALLNELSATQDDVLALLDEKRRLLVSRDAAALADMAPREATIVARLQACQQRRSELLDRAAEQQLPNDSIGSLAKTLPEPARKEMTGQVEQAARRFRLLGHHSLANWVLIQRSLLHLSQLLEIIATGGRKSPTYGRVDAVHSGGSLVDQAA